MTGSVIYAVEMFDSSTARLLGAYVSKQYPNASDEVLVPDSDLDADARRAARTTRRSDR